MSVRAGEALRRQGQQQAENAADPRAILQIDAVIARANATGNPWSANEIRRYFCSHRYRALVGARVDAARKRGEMEAVGWVKSDLASTRGKPVTLWVGKPETGAAAPAFLFACFLMLLAGLVVGYVAVSPLLTLDLAR